MACISAESLASGLPFIERMKQPLMRSSSVTTRLARGLNCGKEFTVLMYGAPIGFLPCCTWQLLQFMLAPVLLGSRRRVSFRRRLP